MYVCVYALTLLLYFKDKSEEPAASPPGDAPPPIDVPAQNNFPPPSDAPLPNDVPPPKESPPQPTHDNTAESLPKGDDGRQYAAPMHQPQLIIRSREATKSSPSTATGPYQDLRVSRMDYVQVYNVTTTNKTGSNGDDAKPKEAPPYANLPK